MSQLSGVRRSARTAVAVVATSLVLVGCGEQTASLESVDDTFAISSEASAVLQDRVRAAQEAAADKDWATAHTALREVRQLVRQFEQTDDLDPAKAAAILQAVSELETALPAVSTTEPPSEDATTPPPSEEEEDEDEDEHEEEDD